ncbi:hypothetical protein J4U53_09265, partial [Escherichia coli]
RLRFSGPKTSIICSPMTSLKTSIKTITYLSDIGCLEIQGASLPSTTPRLKYELSSGHIQKHEFAQYCKRGDSSGIIWQCIEQLLHVRLL